MFSFEDCPNEGYSKLLSDMLYEKSFFSVFIEYELEREPSSEFILAWPDEEIGVTGKEPGAGLEEDSPDDG